MNRQAADEETLSTIRQITVTGHDDLLRRASEMRNHAHSDATAPRFTSILLFGRTPRG
jgi:hypothetical protein